MRISDDIIHAIAGGSAGCVGAVITSPLEVVKTRFQSSVASFDNPQRSKGGNSELNPSHTVKCASTNHYHHGHPPGSSATSMLESRISAGLYYRTGSHLAISMPGVSPNPPHTQAFTTIAGRQIGLVECFRYIVKNEGVSALYKGLTPTLVGIIPSRSIFFTTYEHAKNFLLTQHSHIPDTIVHMTCSAVAAFSACTLTNPIWFIKTRLQLDQSTGGERLTIRKCASEVFRRHGPLGFYKGISASYMAISETMIHIAVYEYLKRVLLEMRHGPGHDTGLALSDAMYVPAVAAFTSKSCASILTYPTEVCRTRLRQEGTKYVRFWQTFQCVWKEEGARALFRGCTIQVLQKVPNTMVTMITYEFVTKLLTDYQQRKQS